MDDGTSARDLDQARRLMDAYNANKDPSHGTTPSSEANPSSDVDEFRSSYEDQKSRTSVLPWPHHPPLYLRPMSLSTIL